MSNWQIKKEWLKSKGFYTKNNCDKLKPKKQIKFSFDNDSIDKSILLAEKFAKNPTKWELIIKDYFDANHVEYEFQKVIPSNHSFYVLDFYINGINIEIDGYYHFTRKGYLHDKKRTAYLKSIGIKTLRFKNNTVEKDFIKVYDKLLEHGIL